MEGTAAPLNSLVEVYIKIRDAIRAKEEEHEQEIAVLKEQFEAVGNKILDICNEQGVDSIRTPVGTVTRKVSSRYWTSDWDSMYKFIRENDAYFLLEQRIHNSNMRTFLEDHPDRFPMGLHNDRKYTVQVRKPTAK